MSEWKAVAVYDFQSTNEVELELKKGDIVTIRRKSVGEGWWEGERQGVRGLIPMKFVKKMAEMALSEEGSSSSLPSCGDQTSAHSSCGWEGDGGGVGDQQTSGGGGSSRPGTPRGSKRELMENLMLPETGSIYDEKKAREVFTAGGNGAVEVISGPAWSLECRRTLHVVILNPRIQQASAFSAPHIVYEVETKELEVVVTRRYKHFLWLYDKLADLFPCVSLPPLPVKQVSGNAEAQFIESRKRALERFLNRVINHPVLGNSKALYEFLTQKDPKDWKIGSKMSSFSLIRNSTKRLFAPSFYSAVKIPPHNYAMSQLQSIEEFSQFSKLIDVNMAAIKQSCLELANQNGEMGTTVHQIGKDLGRFVRGEEPPMQPSSQTTRKPSSSANPLRSAAELEESADPEVRDWAWQGSKSFTSLLEDVASVSKGIERIAQLCSFQQDMMEQSTVNTLQDYSGILHTVPGIVKLHEDAMKAYKISKEKDSRKDAESMKMSCESLSNIVLAEIGYVHDQIVSDMKEMISELLAGQVSYHQRMAGRWSELHAKFTHGQAPDGSKPTNTTDSATSVNDSSSPENSYPYMNMEFEKETSKTPASESDELKAQAKPQGYYSQQRIELAGHGFSSFSQSPPPIEHRGYEMLTETLGGRGLLMDQKSLSYGDISSKSSDRDDVYLPFVPGVGLVNSAEPKKKAADYTPFVPLGRKSDPGLLDYDSEPRKPHGYTSFVPLKQRSEGMEEFFKEGITASSTMTHSPLVYSSSSTSEEKKPSNYLSFVPAQRDNTTSIASSSVFESVGVAGEEEGMGFPEGTTEYSPSPEQETKGLKKSDSSYSNTSGSSEMSNAQSHVHPLRPRTTQVNSPTSEAHSQTTQACPQTTQVHSQTTQVPRSPSPSVQPEVKTPPHPTHVEVTISECDDCHLRQAPPILPGPDNRPSSSSSPNLSSTHSHHSTSAVTMATNDEPLSRDQPMVEKRGVAVDPKPNSAPQHSNVKRPNGEDYARRKVEVGDSASSSGESSPSPCIRSIYSDAISNNVSWNNSNGHCSGSVGMVVEQVVVVGDGGSVSSGERRRSSECSEAQCSSLTSDRTSLPDSGVHSLQRSQQAASSEGSGVLSDTSPVAPTTDAKLPTSGASSSNRSSGSSATSLTPSDNKVNIGNLIQRFQAPPRPVVSTSDLKLSVDRVVRRQKSSPSCKPLQQSSSSSSLSSAANDPLKRNTIDNASLRRTSKKGKLESLGIIEDSEGGSFAV